MPWLQQAGKERQAGLAGCLAGLAGCLVQGLAGTCPRGPFHETLPHTQLPLASGRAGHTAGHRLRRPRHPAPAGAWRRVPPGHQAQVRASPSHLIALIAW